MLVAQQFGISDYSVFRWAILYRQYGEQELMDRQRQSKRLKLPAAVTQHIVYLKKENPEQEIKRTSDVLGKNPAKPRIFERARPNQMRQGDILNFHLAGKNAYMIGYIDDIAEYISALPPKRPPTAVGNCLPDLI